MINPATLTPSQYIVYGNAGYDSHVIRFLLAEKSLDYSFIHLDDYRPEELAEFNPYATLPIFLSRDIALYEINIIFEYLEDRHGANKLLPNTPNERAKIRTLAWRLQKDWLKLGRILMTHSDSYSEEKALEAKKKLQDSLITLAPLFSRHEFFMSERFGWCDVLLAPLLYRLDGMKVELPSVLAKPVIEYANRIFQRKSFQKTLVLPPAFSEFDDENEYLTKFINF